MIGNCARGFLIIFTAIDRAKDVLRLIILIALAGLAVVGYAQTGLSLEIEINNIERSITRQGVTAEERQAALVNLAQLRQLSGDIEGAARNWLEAAAAIPGRVDDNALLNCAYCLAAMGEWERASAALLPLVSRYKRANFLNITINSIQTGNLNELENLAYNPEYSGFKHEILFILWKLSGNVSWRNRLVNEFPQTPEGRLASGAPIVNQGSAGNFVGSSTGNIFISPAPFWFLLNSPDIPAVSASTNSEVSNRLQTGIFSQQVNAENMAVRLRQVGFAPVIEQRVSGSSTMWAVVVPAGANENRTIQELRTAGFESFPVR